MARLAAAALLLAARAVAAAPLSLSNTAAALLLAARSAAAAPLSISNVFGSAMVFQRDAPVAVWGWITPGASIRGSLGADAAAGAADATGLWRLAFKPVAATGAAMTLSVAAPATGETLTLTGLLAGDVYFCSGQSNMEFTVNAAFNASAEIAAANDYPMIRVTSGPLQGKLNLRTLGPQPYKNRVAVDLPWSVANNASIGGVGDSGGWDYYSAACWNTLKNVADRNAAAGAPVPLGGIVECYGGTSIQWWSGPQTTAACPTAANPGSSCCNYGGNQSCLFNAQIAPYTIGPTRVAGFLWYQGEQNAGCGGVPQLSFYACALPALIAEWRALFASPAAPFGIFELAAWSATTAAFPLLRLVQVATAAALPRVFTASTLDMGTPGGPVHSIYKQVPGQRAARALDALVYGRATPFLGPRAVAARAAPAPAGADATAAVDFDAATLYGAPLALVPEPACPLPLNNCEGFAVQVAPSCAWVNATAAADAAGTGLVLTLPAAARPAGARIVAVRGYFGNWPLVSVYGVDSLPMEPFLLNVTGASNPCAPPQADATSWVLDAAVHA